MQRCIFVFSTLVEPDSNGFRVFFRRTVEVKPNALPILGAHVPPLCLAEQFKAWGIQTGVIMAFHMEGEQQWVYLGTPTPLKSLRECLQEEKNGDGKKAYEEVLMPSR